MAIALPEGVIVVDIDGQEGFDALSTEGYVLPVTATVATSHGRHFYYTLPLQDGRPARVKNAVRILPGTDLRASGGYVIGPPSVHPRCDLPVDPPLDAITDAPGGSSASRPSRPNGRCRPIS